MSSDECDDDELKKNILFTPSPNPNTTYERETYVTLRIEKGKS